MQNLAEEFVFNLCKNTFLSLWSYTNPLGKNNKELCDILVVCDPDIIIFSVKEIKVTQSKDVIVDWERWNRRAIKKSSKQLDGAERWIKSTSFVIRRDGTTGLPFPNKDIQKIHKVVVALGSEDKIPMFYGDFGKGFVHVFDEQSFSIIAQELDTITDFIEYLASKEDFYSSAKTPLLSGEENLLALYLHKGRKFPKNIDSVILENNLWENLIKKPEYLRKKEEDRISYLWDGLIEDISNYVMENKLEFRSTNGDGEKILRVMANESRFTRRILSKNFAGFISLSSKNILRARISPSPSGILYVFLALAHNAEKKYRRSELGTRCFVARGINQEYKTVIGIGMEQYKPGAGHSFYLCYLHKPEWNNEDQVCLKGIQNDCGFFVDSVRNQLHEDEYPMEKT